MSKEGKYKFIPVCVMASARGLLQVDANGVVILTTADMLTGNKVTVCLSSSTDETEGFIGAIKHALEHQRAEVEKADPERKVDHFSAGVSFDQMMKDIKKLH